MATSIFINLPVKDLDRSMDFFKALGYSFNPQFTNEQAACMVITDTIYAMLLTEPFFQTFTTKRIADATDTVEAIIALSTDSRAAVDAHMEKALAAGAKDNRAPQDYGFMYSRSFQDLDGHNWEVFWMDPANVKPAE